MKISFRNGLLALFVGDILIFFISLWLALFLRAGTMPSFDQFELLVPPFSLLFIVWLLVFFIAGLYDKTIVLFSQRLPGLLFRALLVNIALAVGYFYFFSAQATPKTILFIYSIVMFFAVLLWRLFGYRALSQKKPQNAIVVGHGSDIREMQEQIAKAPRYGFVFVDSIDLDTTPKNQVEEILRQKISEKNISYIVLDFSADSASELLGHFYRMLFSQVTFIRFDKLYEEIFSRIPLSSLGYHWFLENVSFVKKVSYDIGKRLMDIVVSAILLVVTSPLLGIAALASIQEKKGPVFIFQNRIGKGGKIINIPKLRSMTVNDNGIWPTEGDARITRVGKILRKSRIDELPQLWSVIKGDLSLIGPRPDIQGLGVQLEKDIPYYAIRNVVAPGLSGWAQIMQEKPPHTLEETKLRLSYDFYYIKNRSLLLDLQIALRTIKTLLSRLGV